MEHQRFLWSKIFSQRYYLVQPNHFDATRWSYQPYDDIGDAFRAKDDPDAIIISLNANLPQSWTRWLVQRKLRRFITLDRNKLRCV